MTTPKWAQRPIKNILLDINGVLYESGEEHPIQGSVGAMKRLVAHGFEFCLVTNECTTPKRLLTKKLNDFGYDMITPAKIVSPAPTACNYIMERSLRPRFHVWPGVLEDFEPAINLQNYLEPDQRGPANCIVIGDVMNELSRDFIDESLEMMLKSPDTPEIISLGDGRYYKDSGKLRMDTGAFARAFAYALGQTNITCLGKPSKEFFNQAISVVSRSKKGCQQTDKPAEQNIDETIMIGDDVVSDVGGAQKMGMRGFLVKTGKYKPSDETRCDVKPDDVFDNLSDAIDRIIANNPCTS